MHPIHTKKGKRTLLKIKKILDKADIKFWLWGGTLLGAVREGRFIPTDWDIDLMALAGDWKPEVASEFEEAFEYVDFRKDELYQFGYRKIHLKKGTRLSLIFYLYYAPKDVFVFPKMTGGKYVNDPRWCELSPSLLNQETFIKFLDKKFRIPHKSEELLEKMYGSTWRKPQRGGWMKSVTFKPISPEEFIPWILGHPKESMRGSE